MHTASLSHPTGLMFLTLEDVWGVHKKGVVAGVQPNPPPHLPRRQTLHPPPVFWAGWKGTFDPTQVFQRVEVS